MWWFLMGLLRGSRGRKVIHNNYVGQDVYVYVDSDGNACCDDDEVYNDDQTYEDSGSSYDSGSSDSGSYGSNDDA